MLVIAAMLKATQGKGDELEKEFRTVMQDVRKEPNNLTYTVHRALDDNDKFFVYEKYRDKEALDYHTSTPYFKAFSKSVAGILEGRAEIGFYREIV
jgi:quinol monooxygenase YgiN